MKHIVTKFLEFRAYTDHIIANIIIFSSTLAICTPFPPPLPSPPLSTEPHTPLSSTPLQPTSHSMHPTRPPINHCPHLPLKPTSPHSTDTPSPSYHSTHHHIQTHSCSFRGQQPLNRQQPKQRKIPEECQKTGS